MLDELLDELLWHAPRLVGEVVLRPFLTRRGLRHRPAGWLAWIVGAVTLVALGAGAVWLVRQLMGR